MTARPARDASLTEEVVAELVPHVPPLRCCRGALLEGMRLCGDSAEAAPGPVTTRLSAARAAIQTLHSDGIAAHVVRRRAPRRPRYEVALALSPQPAEPSTRNCCARSMLRGAFLTAGSVSRPDAEAHLEILCRSCPAAERVVAGFHQLGIPVTAAARRGHWVVAARSVEAVAVTLSSIGAQHGRLRFEEGRVLREMRASVNRRLNGETANLRRTVSAGVHQLLALDALEEQPNRWERLPPALREAAVLRRRYPQDSLEGLAARAGCSRSAMAGRLRRLLAEAATGGSLGGRGPSI